MNKKVKPYLITRSLQPENQESPIHFIKNMETPLHYFYRRNHFPYPVLNQYNYWLQVAVGQSKKRYIHLSELLAMPATTLTVPLECAGNKRAKFSTKVYGEQWEDGAISQGEWTGVPLRNLLKDTELTMEAQEIVFEGADRGKKPGNEGLVPYKRSLPLEKALHPDTLVAYKYNNKPLTVKHGHPFRLIVPNWYAMASVKWLQKIEIIKHKFTGPFQTEDYMYYPNKNNNQEKVPVTTLNVNSTIQQPLNYSILNSGTHKVEGIAWTGQGKIKEVQVSFDNGQTWTKANLSSNGDSVYSWIHWSLVCEFNNKGEYTILSRAVDSSGRVQPHTPFWNRKGYGFNAVSTVHVKVE
ncbi:sulfite oxidase [Mesobacillus maritimus]|uniref:sulfite oxidase n=1 Tax=Mesobacillus maritimus TaxID=1643336 RepID=UPI00384EE646